MWKEAGHVQKKGGNEDQVWMLKLGVLCIMQSGESTILVYCNEIDDTTSTVVQGE